MEQTAHRPSSADSAAVLLAAVLLFAALPAIAAEPCPANPTFEQSSSGNAGLWDNFRKNTGSVRSESDQLLQQGLARLEAGQEMIFTSVPGKFRKDYPGKNQCEALAEKTAKQPLAFEAQLFPTLEELAEWISKFSQGKGRQGTLLYSQCPGMCSPQYRYRLTKTGSKLKLEPSAVCGPARDKNDNKYRLQLTLRPACSAAAQSSGERSDTRTETNLLNQPDGGQPVRN